MLDFIIANIIISITSFGGGKAFIPIYQQIFVDQYRFINNIQFTEIIAYANSMPGPFSPLITGPVGFDLFGIIGAILGLLSVSIPSLIIFFIVMYYTNKLSSSLSETIFKYLSPLIISLLIFVSFELVVKTSYQENYLKLSLSLFFISYVLLYTKKIHPFLLIVVSGIIGVIYLQ